MISVGKTAKLVSVESGEVVPLPGTARRSYGGVNLSDWTAEKQKETLLLIDGNDITIIDGWSTDVLKNHYLELYSNSNYKELPLTKGMLYLINFKLKTQKLRDVLRNIIYTPIRYLKHIRFLIRKAYQIIFSKYHVSDYEVGTLFHFLAIHILPRMKAFRELYTNREVLDVPSSIEDIFPPQYEKNQTILDAMQLASTTEDEYADKNLIVWEAVMDEIIFAFRWILEAETSKRESFYNEYYGQYFEISDDDNDNKNHEQYIASYKRAHLGLELFGKFFTEFWY